MKKESKQPLSLNEICITTLPIVGKVEIYAQDSFITRIGFANKNAKTTPTKSIKSIAIKNLLREFAAYGKNPTLHFIAPLAKQGTLLQQKIWQVLQKIPHGTTATYSEIAAKLHTSPRVVGNACRKNPYLIAVPCHRVVAKNGGLGGYAGKMCGKMLEVKKQLLKHERATP